MNDHKMNKKIGLVFITGFLLGCNFLFPQTPRSSEPVVPRPTKTGSEAAPIGFSIVRLHPENGELQTMLAQEAQKAVELGRMPIVEFDATWCPPCRAIDEGLKTENKLMLAAYDGTYIIKLDVDEWGWNGRSVQDFRFTGIPVYFKLDAHGNQTGEVIDGGAWGEDIPENIAPVMDEFFHGE